MFKKTLILSLVLISQSNLAATPDHVISNITESTKSSERSCTAEALYAVLTMPFEHGCGHRSNPQLLKNFAELITACEAGKKGEFFDGESYLNPAHARCAHEFGSGRHHILAEAIINLKK